MAHAKSSNPNEFILPDLGEGVHEAELIRWLVNVGDKVEEHQTLAEMNTDKALVEVPSPRPGTIASLHGEPGQILFVGNVLVTYEGGAAGTAGTKSSAAKETPAKAPVKGTHANGSHAPAPVTAAPAESSDSYERTEDDGTVVGSLSEMASVTAAPGKVLATPAVRRLARDLGVEINTVGGTGIAGRVTEKDVRAAVGGGPKTSPARQRGSSAPAPAVHHDVAPLDRDDPHSAVVEDRVPMPGTQPGRHAPATKPKAPPAPAARPAGATGGAEAPVTRTPLRGVRRNIAQRLRQSVDQAVHFTVMDEADISALDILRKKLSAASGEKVSVLPFVASAVCRVLSEQPFRVMNSTVDEKAGADGQLETEVIGYRAVHLGIATDTDNGLMVPVIRDADGLGVLEIARSIAGIADAARSRTIARDQLIGSTFTISNVGSHAGRFATPVINYPEVAIVAVGRARPSPVVRSTSAGPAFAIGNLLPLSLACDHRVVDGATAALALAKIVELLQAPEQLLGPARG
jgi:pyruvate dehydrogenase E2 component (dihydrolipoamide acetyltransferase)